MEYKFFIPMKKTHYLVTFATLFLFQSMSLLSQDQINPINEDSPLLVYKTEISEAFSSPPADGTFLAGKSFDWMVEWMPDFSQERFKDELWIKINNHFKIGVEIPEKTNASLRIFTANGDLLKEENHQLQKGVNRFPIDAHDWEKGGYIIQIQTGYSGILKKLIKI